MKFKIEKITDYLYTEILLKALTISGEIDGVKMLVSVKNGKINTIFPQIILKDGNIPKRK